ncbi:MAG TPA: low affinity iron permease family protein [Acidobacteriaceae bacterium]|nr:low affinity iron permease family protein [Acidobacteriaceae bacterium]
MEWKKPAGELTLASKQTVPKQAAKDPVEEIRSRIATETRGEAFGRFAAAASTWLGSKWAFIGAFVVIAAWAITGPIFHYSDTWQLIINTGTTIVTFLMVFLIQNTQNRDSRAINLKLNELIRSIDAAGDEMMDIEKLSDEDLDRLQKRYERIREQVTKRGKDSAPKSKESQPNRQ